MKEIIGYIAVSLVFIAYVPYIKDLLKGKTIPHVYSWFVWSFLTLLIAFMQIKNGAGVAGGVTLSAGIVSLFVFAYALYKRESLKFITKLDTFFLSISLVAFLLWLLIDNELYALLLASFTEVIAFVPTIRKSWNLPYTETLSLYGLNTIRFVLAVFAIEKYSIITTLYPVTWAIGNGLFAFMLIYRRRKI
ncbi:MAG: hypothetical protein Q9M91_02180 [Candidatus Dojkabacteria bacterium]|nr:hypothetical protein [Candidatus Dojkabacteria bacterium]MDQ7020632.1 hypothetical protein [Candidatus Dojkabacteria bacterium]